jgi:hypothetical protein
LLLKRESGPFYRRSSFVLLSAGQYPPLEPDIWRGGIRQYQCVIPEPGASAALRELLKRIASSRHASFLAVLKRMGPAGNGMLSFPMLGYTLALDLSLRDPDLFKLLDELDELVMQHGGRVYLAKDARLSAASFRRMYPRYGEWLAVKNRLDPRSPDDLEHGPTPEAWGRRMSGWVLLLGASVRNCARYGKHAFAAAGYHLCLAGRDIDELQRDATDLALFVSGHQTCHSEFDVDRLETHGEFF